jgi:uncharacterized caspase-like protein
MRRRLLGTVAWVIGWLGASPLLAQPAAKYAILVGVAKYEHAGMSPLEFPEADAKAIAELLKTGGYDVDLLLGRAATHKAILAKLDGLSRKGTADGVVVVGLFGHGVESRVRNEKNQVILDDQNIEVTEGCFCPFDTDIRLALDEKGNKIFGKNREPLTEPDPATLIKLADLMISLKLAKAGSRVVFADCCREVPNAARGRSFGASFQAKDLPQNTSVLFGCSPREKAFEHRDWGHGAFTKCLLEELPLLVSQGDAETGVLSARLKKKVPLLVASVSPSESQTPVPFLTNTVDLQLANLKPVLPGNPKPTSPSPPAKSPNDVADRFSGTQAGEQKVLGGVNYRWCPAGSFRMGTPGATDDETPVDVTLSGFWLSETEVTQGQWTSLMSTTPWEGKEYVKAGANYAASYVSHADALAYCEQLTERERKSGRLPAGWKYALPSEAQWEYACRAGTTTQYSFGDSEAELGTYAWYAKNADAVKEKYAHAVGQKRANGWGLKDMHGNVWEWCGDWYGRRLAGGRDPVGPSSGSGRVLRGGGWRNAASGCRSASRSVSAPGGRSDSLGLRVAAVPSP